MTNAVDGATVVGLGYDVQGNLNNKNGQVYNFDFGNRLRGVNGVASYVYDGHGRRVRDYTTASKYSLYSQSGQLVFDNDGRAGKSSQYVYLGGSLMAVREAVGSTTTVKYQHTDALGTPVAVTDAAKAIVQTSEYEPYGQLVNRPLTDGPGFTGHVQDAATGLTYMQQRYYDPMLGRFLSVDPVTVNSGTGANFNRYWYANNNPYKFIDPDGREIVSTNPQNNAQLLGHINSKALGVFRFDGNNKLQLVSATGDAKKFSAYYQQRLVDGINSSKKISLDVAQNYTDQQGNNWNVDANAGGGLTESFANGDQNVVISGNPNTSLLDTSGSPLTDAPADILGHELVGHAIPRAVGPDTGNAVDNENKIRNEVPGSGQRAPEPNHHE